MDGRYPPPVPPVDPSYTIIPAHGHSDPYRRGSQYAPTNAADEYSNLPEYDAAGPSGAPHPAQPRQRRRQNFGPDHVKHRRTRSGCYTCRHRRVKCDEAQPTCERCRKGKRECSYPGVGTVSPKRSQSLGTLKELSPDSHSNSSGDDSGVDEDEAPSKVERVGFQPLRSEGEPQSTASTSRKQSRASSIATAKDSKLASDSSTSPPPLQPKHMQIPSGSKHSTKKSISGTQRWHRLPEEIKLYVNYHRQKLSHHHYAWKYDGDNFLKTTLIEVAFKDESAALLYAIAAFAAYHHNFMTHGNRISNFLTIYNKSIILLRQSMTNKRPTTATLLTILQLAAIEEFLGDWLNLLGHQRAAHQILTDLYTPQTVMQDETQRRILTWYTRFDLFAGIMSGGETVLGREWFASAAEHYETQAQKRPDNLGLRFETFFAAHRLLATDAALFFAAKTKNAISDEHFEAGAAKLSAGFAALSNKIENTFKDRMTFVKEFPRAPPPSEDDIVDFRDPNFLVDGELYTMNYVRMDFWAVYLMFRYQLALATRAPPSPELTELALKLCKGLEAIQYYDGCPPGAILLCQGSLGLASLFLPKDKKHTDWCRRKYALIEQNGYIYSSTLHQRMSDLWGEDVTQWWLPNNEGYPDIIRAIRDFLEYRARLPKDGMSADVRDMAGIFRHLKIAEEPVIPEDLYGMEAEIFDPNLLDAATWESSPDTQWT